MKIDKGFIYPDPDNQGKMVLVAFVPEIGRHQVFSGLTMGERGKYEQVIWDQLEARVVLRYRPINGHWMASLEGECFVMKNNLRDSPQESGSDVQEAIYKLFETLIEADLIDVERRCYKWDGRAKRFLKWTKSAVL